MRKTILIYICGFFLAIHYASVAYVNSSFLKSFVTDTTISILYIIGSILSVISIILAPSFLRNFGNARTLLIFIALEILAVFGMGNTELGIAVMLLFLMHQAVESMLYLGLDIELEKEIKKEGVTGGRRGAFLTAQNIAWVVAPLLISFFISDVDFSKAYTISAGALVPFLIIGALYFNKNIKNEAQRSHIGFAFKNLFKEKDEAKIIGAQFILHFFFSWMIIYLPLLLHEEIGFGWDKIGLILTIMLVPYLIFELPAGILEDKKIGEKETLFTGFIIISLATLTIPFIESSVFWIWASILFITRIGASLVEISSESYFFKHVKDRDTGLISLFRTARPASFILAPVISIPILYFTDYSGSFLFLGLFSLLGLTFIPKKDTK